MCVLLIEDVSTASNETELILRTACFQIDKTNSGEEGLDQARVKDFDIIILSLELPDMKGEEILSRLRRTGNDTPVVILSDISDTECKLKSFGLGADDFMVKPFHREELIARIRAVIRRSKGRVSSLIRTGLLEVNLNTKSAKVAGKYLNLTEKEYQLIELMSLHKGKTLNKEIFLNHLYDKPDRSEFKNVNTLICKLRKKLMIATNGVEYIETIWGRGYVLRDPSPTTLGKQIELPAA